MSVYESNYLRLKHLVPDLERLDGCYRSRVAGDCDLHLEIMERSRYTVTMSLTYYFETDEGRVADPDLLVRAYLDGQLAEAMNLGGVDGDYRHAALRRLVHAHRRELDARWQRNIVLNKWLDYLIEQGHLILD
ncbi:MAG: DUF1249 domain-containing protein [Woeseiaceae bacterium]|nr:DUF1249 domain-containing protein [Woeseiaceae bacterium]